MTGEIDLLVIERCISYVCAIFQTTKNLCKARIWSLGKIAAAKEMWKKMYVVYTASDECGYSIGEAHDRQAAQMTF